jgi:hypothetical protein
MTGAVVMLRPRANEPLQSVAERLARVLISRLIAGTIPKIDLDVIEAACDALKPTSRLHRNVLIDLTVRCVVELAAAQ